MIVLSLTEFVLKLLSGPLMQWSTILEFLSLFSQDIVPFVFLTACSDAKHIEDLKLMMRGWDLLELKSSAVYLARLRNLNLNRINFFADNFDEFLLGCPILKDLSMECCALKMPKFSCHSVKQLQIHHPHSLDGTLNISAPCVENLDFNGDMDSRITLKDMPKVTQAIVSVHSFVKEEYNCHF